MIYSAIVITALLFAFAFIFNMYRRESWHHQMTLESFDTLREQMTTYKEYYVPSVNEFHYRWTRPSGTVDDIEILEWCLDHAGKNLTYSYKWDGHHHNNYGNVFTVWIREPRLAMEFKLRYH